MKNIEKNKELNNEIKGKFKKIISEAKEAIIVQTEESFGMFGSKAETYATVGCLLYNLFKTKMLTKKDILRLLDNAEIENEKEEDNQNDLDMLDKLLDKAIELKKLMNEDED